MLINQIASDEVLDEAYQWLCEKRAHHHFNGDVWQVRRWWQEKNLSYSRNYCREAISFGNYDCLEVRIG